MLVNHQRAMSDFHVIKVEVAQVIRNPKKNMIIEEGKQTLGIPSPKQGVAYTRNITLAHDSKTVGYGRNSMGHSR